MVTKNLRPLVRFAMAYIRFQRRLPLETVSIRSA